MMCFNIEYKIVVENCGRKQFRRILSRKQFKVAANLTIEEEGYYVDDMDDSDVEEDLQLEISHLTEDNHIFSHLITFKF